MKLTLMVVFVFSSSLGWAQDEDVRIEKIYTNSVAAQADANVYDGVGEEPVSAYGNKYKAKMQSSNSANSPQVNIYNSNLNKNDNLNDNENDQDLDSSVASTVDSAVGLDYIQRANHLRKTRKDMEVGTEQKMIEKIEFSRIEDERRRAERLFGNRLNNTVQQAPQQQEPQVIIVEKEAQPAPQPIVVQEKVIQQQVVHEEAAHVGGGSLLGTWSDNSWKKEAYIAPIIGTSEYGDSINTTGNTAMGVAVGTRVNGGIGVEASFIYSDYELEDFDSVAVDVDGRLVPALKDVQQYNFNIGLKYSMDFQMISPFVGALGSYTFREYEGPTSISSSGTASSNAFDAGLNIGVDVKVTPKFTVSAEYRWMTNVTFDRNDDQNVNGATGSSFVFRRALQAQRKPLEEIDYQMILLSGKLSF